jgi:hypothetical protein
MGQRARRRISHLRIFVWSLIGVITTAITIMTFIAVLVTDLNTPPTEEYSQNAAFVSSVIVCFIFVLMALGIGAGIDIGMMIASFRARSWLWFGGGSLALLLFLLAFFTYGVSLLFAPFISVGLGLFFGLQGPRTEHIATSAYP